MPNSFRHLIPWQQILKQVQDDLEWQEILKQVQDDFENEYTSDIISNIIDYQNIKNFLI